MEFRVVPPSVWIPGSWREIVEQSPPISGTRVINAAQPARLKKRLSLRRQLAILCPPGVDVHLLGCLFRGQLLPEALGHLPVIRHLVEVAIALRADNYGGEFWKLP